MDRQEKIQALKDLASGKKTLKDLKRVIIWLEADDYYEGSGEKIPKSEFEKRKINPFHHEIFLRPAPNCAPIKEYD